MTNALKRSPLAAMLSVETGRLVTRAIAVI